MSVENPFDKKKQERLWEVWKDQESYKLLAKNFSSADLTSWDKEFFISEIWDRMKYIKSIIVHFQSLCDHPNLARDLDTRLRPILNPMNFNIAEAEPKVGEGYLSAVKKSLVDSYLTPIDLFLKTYGEFVADPKPKMMGPFLSEARFMFDSIVNTKDDPFKYHFIAMPSIKDLKTGEVLAGEPKEISIVLKPFEVKMNELANVCRKTIDSIELWVKQREESRQKLIDFTLNQSQVDAAYYQKQTAKWTTWFQIAVIFFAVALTIVADQYTNYSEKWSLERELEELMIKSKQWENGQAKLKEELSSLQIASAQESKLFKQKATEYEKKLNESADEIARLKARTKPVSQK